MCRPSIAPMTAAPSKATLPAVMVGIAALVEVSVDEPIAGLDAVSEVAVEVEKLVAVGPAALVAGLCFASEDTAGTKTSGVDKEEKLPRAGKPYL